MCGVKGVLRFGRECVVLKVCWEGVCGVKCVCWEGVCGVEGVLIGSVWCKEGTEEETEEETEEDKREHRGERGEGNKVRHLVARASALLRLPAMYVRTYVCMYVCMYIYT